MNQIQLNYLTSQGQGVLHKQLLPISEGKCKQLCENEIETHCVKIYKFK
jgi:hypothetical protein